jgi:hypothetical protein
MARPVAANAPVSPGEEETVSAGPLGLKGLWISMSFNFPSPGLHARRRCRVHADEFGGGPA